MPRAVEVVENTFPPDGVVFPRSKSVTDTCGTSSVSDCAPSRSSPIWYRALPPGGRACTDATCHCCAGLVGAVVVGVWSSINFVASFSKMFPFLLFPVAIFLSCCTCGALLNTKPTRASASEWASVCSSVPTVLLASVSVSSRASRPTSAAGSAETKGEAVVCGRVRANTEIVASPTSTTLAERTLASASRTTP